MARIRRGVALAAVAGLVLSAGMACAQPDRIIDTPTGWEYWYGISSSSLDARLNAGFRPFFMNRVGSDAYDVILVRNSGAYATTGTDMTYGASTSAFSTSLALTGRRPLTLQQEGSLIYSVTVPNSGGTAAPGQVWTVGQTSAGNLVDWAEANTVRVFDFDKNPSNGTYGGVGLDNTGANAQSWWWYFGVTEAEVVQYLTQNSARLIDVIVETPTASTPTYSVIMVGQNPGMGIIDLNASSADVENLINYNGCRLTVLERFVNGSGQTRFAVALVDNSSTEERRIRGLMNGAYDGVKTFARKRVNGNFELFFNGDYPTEPASSMKIVHAAYAVDRCASNLADLDTTQVFNESTCGPSIQSWNDACPDNVGTCSPGNLTLGETIRRMMQNSDNMCTNAMERFAGNGNVTTGRATLNSWMTGLGFTNHNINHTLGCLCGNTPNVMSARDFCDFYEMIDDGTLFNTVWQEELYSRMNRWSGSNGTISTIITEEAANTDLTASEIAAFRSRVDAAAKPGGYGCNGVEWRGYAGRVAIPDRGVLAGSPIYSTTEFTGAMFVQGANGSTGPNAVYAHYFELFREPIREALQSWDAGCTPPGVSNQPDAITRNVGADASFSVTASGTNMSRTYQWQRSSSPNGTWSVVNNSSGQVTGATTATLTLLNVQLNDAAYYRVLITSACGSVNSSAARLTVETCIVDLSGDGAVDFNDYLEFLNLYNANNLRVDFNNDGGIDFNDYLEFLNLFNAGC